MPKRKKRSTKIPKKNITVNQVASNDFLSNKYDFTIDIDKINELTERLSIDLTDNLKFSDFFKLLYKNSSLKDIAYFKNNYTSEELIIAEQYFRGSIEELKESIPMIFDDKSIQENLDKLDFPLDKM